MDAIQLRTEYLDNLLGIDIVNPRLFWNCKDGKTQTACQVIALDENGAILWDSGKVCTSSMRLQYGGAALKSRAAIEWRIRLWDETDTPGNWSEAASFEMGLLREDDWQAEWIAGGYLPKRKKRYPVDCFHKRFTCAEVTKARLYITACGLYEARINGERVGSFIMAPGFTDYNERIHYQVYDVTQLIKPGENSITTELADGWYRGCIGAMGIRNVYGKQTKLLAQLELELNDGTRQIICTDETWEWSDDGPIRFADMKDGETIDLLKTPSYKNQAKLATHTVVPTAANNVPVEEHERFHPTISITPSGKQLLDFGQNIAGYIELRFIADGGQKLYFQFAEHLDNAGELDMRSIQCHADKPNATPKQEITLYACAGENHYKTKFAVFGFRYAVLESEIALDENDIEAIAVYSSMEQTGVFRCSDDLINRFVENTLWSMKGNFLDVPTDCPTRERAPWTGDVQIFCKTATYLMDTAAFLRKWMNDVRDRQGSNGKIPCHAPDVRNNEFIAGLDFIKRMDGCCGWADVAVLVPWRLYQMYGDISFLTEAYSSMKAHTLFQIGRTGRTGLFGKPFPKPDKKYISNVGQAFGEWLEPQDVYKQSVIQDFCAPHPEEATAYLAYICGIMADIANITGNTDDRKLYEEYLHGCKNAYHNQFIPVDTDRQSKLVRPLALGILEGTADEQKTFDRLVSSIKKRNYRIGTGFLSTPLILPLLSKMGRTDLAYKMLENKEEPGWLYEVIQGATTVWESWDGGASQNHYSPGSVCEWLFETVCGIRVSGENHFTIAPQPGGTLTTACFRYKSIYGEVGCAWEMIGQEIQYKISIPTNCSASMCLPDGTTHEAAAGIAHYMTALK